MRIDIQQDKTNVYLSNSDNVDSTYNTGDIVKSIVDYFKPWSETGIFLPRLVWMNEDHTALVYERPPFVANIEYHHGSRGQAKELGITNFSIPVPWTIWGIRFNSDPVGIPREIRLFARNRPINSYQDTLHYLTIPNMDPNARCCTGDGFISVYSQPFQERIELAHKAKTTVNITIAERVNHILNLFWHGIFNQDYHWTEEYRLPLQTPSFVLQEQHAGLRALRYLEWWSSQSLEESVMNSYRPANTVGGHNSVDTVERLIQDLDMYRKNEVSALLEKNRLMHRIVSRVSQSSGS